MLPHWIRKILYDRISPHSYSNSATKVQELFKKPTYKEHNGHIHAPYDPKRDDIWREYLYIPKTEAHDFSETFEYPAVTHVLPATNVPSKGYDKNINSYKKIPLSNSEKEILINESQWVPVGTSHTEGEILRPYFGHYTTSSGIDPINGQYVSYYDLWDINPLVNGKPTTMFDNILQKIIKNNGDMFNRKPLEFYDRIYLDDYYNINSRPQNSDEYYGGYIIPSIITTNKHSTEKNL